MYLIEYYFGYDRFIIPMRIVGGPFFLLIGLVILYQFNLENDLLLSGLCFIFGFFLILRPYIQILFVLPNFRTEDIDVLVTNESVIIQQESTQSVIKFSSCTGIKERKKHYTFIFDRSRRVQIPKHVFTDEQYTLLREHFK